MDPDPDPTSDPTPFFTALRKQKKSYFFLINYPQAHYLQFYKFNSLLKLCVKIIFCKHYFILLDIFMCQGKNPDPDPGGPKTCGSGSPTLVLTVINYNLYK